MTEAAFRNFTINFGPQHPGMSGQGQKRKGSRRADVFRFTPGSRRSNGPSLKSRLGHIRTSLRCYIDEFIPP